MEVTHGATLLAAFIAAHELCQAQSARLLGVSRAVFSSWLAGRTSPRPELRLAIERWTAGAVPAESWLSEKDRAVIAAVVPLGVAA